MPDPGVRPPRLGRLLLAARHLGRRRSEVEADFLELLETRAAAHGPRYARRRYVIDAASLWRHRSQWIAAIDVPRKRGQPMQNVIADLRYGIRVMRKAPGFTAVAVLSLALGIGANTALFSIADAVLLKTLPVKEPNRLVLFNWQSSKLFRITGSRGVFVPGGYPPGMRGSSIFHARIFKQFRALEQSDPNSPLASLFAFADLPDLSVIADGQAEFAKGEVVSGSYFSGLGVPPLIGRTIADADDTPADASVAVISYRYWQDRFAADRNVIGKQIVVNQRPVSIIGVMPASFTGPSQVNYQPAILLPLALAPMLEPNSPMADRPGHETPWWLLVMGRLAPGATLEQARAHLSDTFERAALDLMPAPTKPNQLVTLERKDYPQLLAWPGGRGSWEMRSIYSPKIKLLFGVVGFVLLIACANVANLLLSRSVLRAPEITLRLAMGAGRWRVVRQLLTESVLLSALGGAFGVLFAVWGTHALAALSADDSLLPSGVSYGLNWRVLAFTAAASLLTGILFGVVPAWRSAKRDLTLALKETNRAGSHASRSWFSRGLVVAQVALSLVLLVGAGLFLRTLTTLQRVDMGFDQQRLLVFGLRPGANGYEGARLTEFYRRVSDQLDAIPGVRAATFAQMPLVAHYSYNDNLILPGETAAVGGDPSRLMGPANPSSEHTTNELFVRENFFEALHIPLIQGRPLTDRDDAGAPKVAVINETLAKKYFPKGDALGQRIGFDAKTLGQIEIVGVTRDIIYNSQREDKEPLIYLPWRQADSSSEMYFAIRTAGDPMTFVPAVRDAVRSIDSMLPLTSVTTQVAQSSDTLDEERQYAVLIGLAGALALLLAAIGLYGVMAYSVTQRTSEIGIRMALGARTGNVLRLVLWQGMKLVLMGLAAGSAGAWALRTLIASQLFGIQPGDPATLVVVGTMLLATALVACFIPARRAAKLDPLIALRIE